MGYRWVPDNVSCVTCNSRGSAGSLTEAHTLSIGFAGLLSHGAQLKVSSSPPFQSTICPWQYFQTLLPQDTPSPSSLHPHAFVHAVPFAWDSLLPLRVDLPQISPPCGDLAAVLPQPRLSSPPSAPLGRVSLMARETFVYMCLSSFSFHCTACTQPRKCL